MIFDDVSILVVGFDGYKDVWNHCFNLMNKYWPDRPCTYLATSELTPSYEKVNIIPAGKDSEWSKKASKALKQIKTPYVVLLLEDFFITNYVDNYLLENIMNLIKSDNIKFYQLKSHYFDWCKLQTPLYKNYTNIHINTSEKVYTINLQPAIWNREFLLERIGDENYNAWVFECNHLNYAVNTEKIEFLEDDRNLLNITHAIIQSVYLPSAINKLKQIGYSIDSNERKIMNNKDYVKYLLKKIVTIYTPTVLKKPLKLLGKLLKVNSVTDKYKSLNRNND